MFRASLAHRQEFRNCVCSLWYSHVALCNDRSYNFVYGAMVNVIQYNVDVYDCGLRGLVPLVGILSVFVTVRVYAGGPSAVVFLLCYFLVVWFVGSLCGIVSGPLAVILASVSWTCCGWACRILPWLRGRMSSWGVWEGAGSPSCSDGMFAVVTPACGSGISRCRIQLSWILSLCGTRVVSVDWCSGVLVWLCFWVS